MQAKIEGCYIYAVGFRGSMQSGYQYIDDKRKYSISYVHHFIQPSYIRK